MVNPQIYRDAADYLRRNGWVQGELSQNWEIPEDEVGDTIYHEGAGCINGALLFHSVGISYDHYDLPEYQEIAAEVAKTIREMYPNSPTGYSSTAYEIERWNDQGAREDDDVISVLEATAARLEAEVLVA